ncbi:sodium:solute symporter family protein [Vibrio sp. RC27]
MNHYLTIGILISFLLLFLLVAFLASRGSKNVESTTESYIIGGRNMGTMVLLLSMGATYFSTWTLLGSFGTYYRSGVWFACFAVWTIFHGIFVWLFGTRIWLSGKKFGFFTPGQMFEHYYSSKRMRIAVALVGITALVPVMLIQISGGAQALETLTDGVIPYVIGVTVTSLMVGVIVLWAGFKGTAWTDSFMGLFFASILIFTALYSADKAGGFDLFKNALTHSPEKMVNTGNPLKMIELWLGLGFGAWVLPHMWQKYYSASSAEVLGKVAVMTPFWNSWMMAIIPLVVGTAAMIPGVIPSLTDKTSDTILPQLFAAHLPLLGAFVVAGILAAAISTINSQLLSSASIVAEDIVNTIRKKPLSSENTVRVTKLVVALLTIFVFVLALTPSGTGFLVPIASLGFGLGLQIVPSALGILYFKKVTESGAFWGLIVGSVVMIFSALLGLNLVVGSSLFGFIINILVTVLVSKITQPVSEKSVVNYHDMYDEYMVNNTTEVGSIEASTSVVTQK